MATKKPKATEAETSETNPEVETNEVEPVAVDDSNVTELPAPEAAPTATPEELDAEEAEFRALRRDLPGVKGAGAAGIVAISVGKAPTKNEFFRSHRDFRPTVSIVDLEVGMEKQYFAVTPDMVEALAGIGITVTDHTLYPDKNVARCNPRRTGAPGQR